MARSHSRWRSVLAVSWPWAAMALVAGVAGHHALSFPTDRDGDFPVIDRPTFSPFPPAAYRLAEPGDTLDRVALYLACLAAALAGVTAWRVARSDPRASLPWIAGTGVWLALAWDAATPWPTLDGWHGLGWEALREADTPVRTRWAIAAATASLAALILIPLIAGPRRAGPAASRAQPRPPVGWRALAIAGLCLLIGSRVGLPAIEPRGYWSRWALIGAEFAWLGVLARLLPAGRPSLAARLVPVPLAGLLIAVGLGSIWLHRPIDRLRAIVPGRIYISAMPTSPGLPIAHERHRFRTIINLFQEDLPGLRHPLVDEERAFARENGIRYVGSPLGAAHADAFLDETLRLSRDPDAWPILLHCHACMDRTPAWWGIYSFLVEGRPLGDVLRSIEQHRGSRPKASVTLLYNRVLSARDPGRYAADPAAALLRASARGVADPFDERLAEELSDSRTSAARPVSSAGTRR